MALEEETFHLFAEAPRALSGRACPRCRFPMEVWERSSPVSKSVELDSCGRCRGTFFDPGESREIYGDLVDPANWERVDLARSEKSRLTCPRHVRVALPLTTYRVAWEEQEVEIEACTTCGGTWLDFGEGQKLAAIVAASEEKAHRDADSLRGPAQYIFQLLTGFPVSIGNRAVRSAPYTVATCVVLLVVSLQVWLSGSPHVESWMLHPSEGLERPWTLVTYMLIHTGPLHLISNLYFLKLFGENMEDATGVAALSIVLVLASVVGGLLPCLWTPDQVLPIAGASGAISGLIGAYCALFPHARLIVVWFFFRRVVRVYVFVVAWLLLQVGFAVFGDGATAWMVHLGGFAAGIAVGGVMRLHFLRPLPRVPKKG